MVWWCSNSCISYVHLDLVNVTQRLPLCLRLCLCLGQSMISTVQTCCSSYSLKLEEDQQNLHTLCFVFSSSKSFCKTSYMGREREKEISCGSLSLWQPSDLSFKQKQSSISFNRKETRLERKYLNINKTLSLSLFQKQQQKTIT